MQEAAAMRPPVLHTFFYLCTGLNVQSMNTNKNMTRRAEDDGRDGGDGSTDYDGAVGVCCPSE